MLQEKKIERDEQCLRNDDWLGDCVIIDEFMDRPRLRAICDGGSLEFGRAYDYIKFLLGRKAIEALEAFLSYSVADCGEIYEWLGRVADALIPALVEPFRSLYDGYVLVFFDRGLDYFKSAVIRIRVDDYDFADCW